MSDFATIRSEGGRVVPARSPMPKELGPQEVLTGVDFDVLAPGREASGGIRLVSPTEALARAAVATVAAGLGGGVRLAPPGGTQVPTMLATVPLGRGVAA